MAETKKKMGRPKKDNPRNVNVQIRYTQDEYDRLKECADRNDLPITQLIRQGTELIVSSLQ